MAPGSGPGVCVLLYLCDSLRNDSNWEKTWIKKKTKKNMDTMDIKELGNKLEEKLTLTDKCKYPAP